MVMTLALAGWAYYAPVEISNPNPYDLLDFQVLIQLDANNFDFSKANADGSDIRFTLSDGETLIPHWIEEWDSANQLAKIWVKVPSIPAEESTTILLWCGNADAVDASDGDGVFILFDDFEGTALDTTKWGTLGDENIVLEDGVAKIINSAIYKQLDLSNIIVTAKILSLTGGYGFFGAFENADMSEDLAWQKGFSFRMDSANTVSLLDYNDGTRSYIYVSKTLPASLEFRVSGSSVDYICDGEVIWTKDLPLATGNLKIGANNGNEIDIDIIYVRKFADTPPSVSIGDLISINTTIINATLTTINVSKATEAFTGDGVTTAFTVQNKPIIPKVRVWVDGVELVEGTDFTVDYNNGTITFATAPASGSTIEILYFYGYIDIVPNATVNITDSAGNVITQTTTDAKGDYSVEVPTSVTLYAVADTADFDAKTEFKIE